MTNEQLNALFAKVDAEKNARHQMIAAMETEMANAAPLDSEGRIAVPFSTNHPKGGMKYISATTDGFRVVKVSWFQAPLGENTVASPAKTFALLTDALAA